MAIIGPNEARLRSEEVRKTQAHRRREQVVALHAAGLSIDEIAAKLGVVRRTVFRDLREASDSITNVDKILHDEPIDAEDLHLRLSQMFDADYADIIDDNGAFKPIKKWPRIWRQMLAGVDLKELFERTKDSSAMEKIGELVKIRFVDPLRVIEIAMKHKAVSALQENQELHLHVHEAVVEKLQGALEREQRLRLAESAQDIEFSTTDDNQ